MTTTTSLDELRKLGTRVQAAERALSDARRLRDDAIRDVRLATRHTVDEIAEAAGVSPATVKSVTRGLR